MLSCLGSWKPIRGSLRRRRTWWRQSAKRSIPTDTWWRRPSWIRLDPAGIPRTRPWWQSAASGGHLQRLLGSARCRNPTQNAGPSQRFQKYASTKKFVTFRREKLKNSREYSKRLLKYLWSDFSVANKTSMICNRQAQKSTAKRHKT